MTHDSTMHALGVIQRHPRYNDAACIHLQLVAVSPVAAEDRGCLPPAVREEISEPILDLCTVCLTLGGAAFDSHALASLTTSPLSDGFVFLATQLVNGNMIGIGA